MSLIVLRTEKNKPRVAFGYLGFIHASKHIVTIIEIPIIDDM
jgi:hypothetical protein